jgi:hypothetical protein
LLDVAHRGRCHVRPGDHAEQVGDLRDRVGQPPQRLVHLHVRHVGSEGALQVGARGGQRLAWQQLIHVVAVARLGGHAARRGVRVVEVAHLLEPVQLVADGRRRPVEPAAARDVLAAHRLAALDVAPHDRAQDVLLPRGELRGGVGVVGAHAKSMICCTTAF